MPPLIAKKGESIHQVNHYDEPIFSIGILVTLDWSERIQLVLDYIENNLAGEISIDAAAGIACSSKYHFHRVFHAMLGVSFSEYVRKRRLSKAGAELLSSKAKIIDIASKYGFNSPNAFTRAFRDLHGINPSQIRTGQVRLSAYKPASYKIKTEAP